MINTEQPKKHMAGAAATSTTKTCPSHNYPHPQRILAKAAEKQA